MVQESFLKRFLFDCGTRDSGAAPGLLFLRVASGLMMFFGHGLPKIQAYAKLREGWYVPDFFPLYFMSPPVSLMATIGAEAVAAICLVLGLMTRPAAFVFCFAMVVAGFGVSGGAPLFALPATGKELALLYLIPGLMILITGAGAWSMDAAILRESKRRRW
jgi:putative oxidoreductase